MAGKNNLLNKLAALVAAFDDASWEALASKGLLRRARKDIEKGLEIKSLRRDGGSVADRGAAVSGFYACRWTSEC